jgi:predicted CXXCH cytochrome family protein
MSAFSHKTAERASDWRYSCRAYLMRSLCYLICVRRANPPRIETTPWRWKTIRTVVCSILLGLAILSTSALAQGPPSDAKYLGPSKCQMCHSDTHKSWQSKKHSKAFELLVNVGEEKNEKCVPCHTTGYGKGGFVDAASTPDLEGVACEACHGPGSEHNGDKTKINRTPSAAVCSGCHQELDIHATT